MADLKTMHDVRTMRSIASRAIPENEGAIFLRLHRLTSEKLRLEREAESWQRKKERIETRLREIEQQMGQLRQLNQQTRVEVPGHARPPWQEIVIEY